MNTLDDAFIILDKFQNPNWDSILYLPHNDDGGKMNAEIIRELCEGDNEEIKQTVCEKTIMKKTKYDELPEWGG